MADGPPHVLDRPRPVAPYAREAGAAPRRRGVVPQRSPLRRAGDIAAAAGLEILGALLGALVALIAMLLGLAALTHRALTPRRRR